MTSEQRTAAAEAESENSNLKNADLNSANNADRISNEEEMQDISEKRDSAKPADSQSLMPWSFRIGYFPRLLVNMFKAFLTVLFWLLRFSESRFGCREPDREPSVWGCICLFRRPSYGFLLRAPLPTEAFSYRQAERRYRRFFRIIRDISGFTVLLFCIF